MRRCRFASWVLPNSQNTSLPFLSLPMTILVFYADIIGGRKYLQWEAYEMDRDGLAEKIVYDVDNGQVVDLKEIGDGQRDWRMTKKYVLQSQQVK